MGERVELVWPTGFTAHRSGMTIEVVAPNGAVVARSGSLLTGAGGGSTRGSDGPFGLCSFVNWHL